MIIIIDAYNFLKAIVSHKMLTQSVVKIWIERFNQYIKKRNNQIILVFDAGPFLGVSKERFGQVEIIYAGQSSTADAYIQEWILKYGQLDVLLVTSDRQIRNHAQQNNVVSISSQEFFSIFNDVMTEAECEQIQFDRSIVKTQIGVTDQALDELLERSTRNLIVDCHKNEYAEHNKRSLGAATKNKKDRAILKKIAKI